MSQKHKEIGERLMTPEESKELEELVEFLKKNNIGEFEFERADTRVRIRFGSQDRTASSLDVAQIAQLLAAHGGTSGTLPAAASQHSSGAAGSEPGAEGDESEEGLHIVKSPIVGTFYESPSPGAPPFVKIGEQVESGQVICIVEAMKLMNEIESDASGIVVKRFVSTGQPVEYGQPLFSLRSN